MMHQSKKCLLIAIIYGSCSLLVFSYFLSNIYPKNEDCLAYKDKINLQRERERNYQIEVNLKTFLNKYYHYNNFSKTDGWIQIIPNIYIYSAYVDKCPDSISHTSSFCVLFIGITFTNETESLNINCAVQRSSNVMKAGLVILEKLPEHHYKPYTAAYFYCDIKSFSEDLALPDYATLYVSSIDTWLPVKHLVPYTLSSKVAVNLCVRPLFGTYYYMYLIEFLVYYSTMGIEHFIFYHQNVTESTYTFFKFLQSMNFSVEILSWDVPLDNDLIHEYGQMVFTQDCIVRSRYKFSHTVIVDIDEFIVPKLHSSIKELISHLDEKYKNAGSYSIAMVLFCEEYINDKSNTSVFRYFNYNKRQKTPWYHGYRSKYIVRSDRVLYGGIHFVWKHQKSWFEVKVSGSVALLHHYRHCCGFIQTWFLHLFSFYVLNDDVVLDNSLIVHSQEIVNTSLIAFVLHLPNFAPNSIQFYA